MWAHLDLDLVLWLLAARRALLQPGLSHQGLLLLVAFVALGQLGTFQLWDRGGIIPLLCLAGVAWPGVPRAGRAAAPFPILAAPSWVGGSAASCFSVFPRFVNIINNEKQPGVYYFALIYAFGFFLRGNQLRFSDEPSSSQQLSETLAMNCIQSAASTFVCGLDK